MTRQERAAQRIAYAVAVGAFVGVNLAYHAQSFILKTVGIVIIAASALVVRNAWKSLNRQ